MVLLSVSAQAQRFDWAKAYTGYGGDSDIDIPGNVITSSVVDKEGNLYIVANFYPGHKIFGVEPIPPDLSYINYTSKSVMIAKISPDGEVLWHKGIHSKDNTGANSGNIYARGIKLLGDSAVMVYATIPFPFYEDEESNGLTDLWYLDTLLLHLPPRWTEVRSGNALLPCFMTLSLDDGRLIEDHMISTCAADENGEPIKMTGVDYIDSYNAYIQRFDVDQDGNIYVLNQVDAYHFANLPASKLGFLIDNRHFVWYRDQHRSGRWNYEIVKFSPHFDTVLQVEYLFDSTDDTPSDFGYPQIMKPSFRLDSENNLYVSLSIQDPHKRYPISNSDTLAFIRGEYDIYSNLLIKYNSDLVPQFVKQLHSTNERGNTSELFIPRWFFSGTVEFDDETNSLYWTGATHKTSAGCSHTDNTDINIFYGNDTLDLVNNFYWLRLDRDDGRLISYGKARYGGQFHTELYGHRDEDPRIAVANGKVAATFCYVGDVIFADTTIVRDMPMGTESSGMLSSTALGIWDDDGNELKLQDFNASHLYNQSGHVCLHDSILYITFVARDGASFADFQFASTGGRSQSILTKYVDTMLMAPGGNAPTNEGIDDPQTLTQSSSQAIKVFPNPTTGMLHIELNDNALTQSSSQAVKSVTLYNTMGQQVKFFNLTDAIKQSSDQTITIDLSPLPAGVYYLTVATGEGNTRHKVVKR